TPIFLLDLRNLPRCAAQGADERFGLVLARDLEVLAVPLGHPREKLTLRRFGDRWAVLLGLGGPRLFFLPLLPVVGLGIRYILLVLRRLLRRIIRSGAFFLRQNGYHAVAVCIALGLRRQQRGQFPVFLGFERLDFTLTFDNEANGDRLHAA